MAIGQLQVGAGGPLFQAWPTGPLDPVGGARPAWTQWLPAGATLGWPSVAPGPVTPPRVFPRFPVPSPSQRPTPWTPPGAPTPGAPMPSVAEVARLLGIGPESVSQEDVNRARFLTDPQPMPVPWFLPDPRVASQALPAEDDGALPWLRPAQAALGGATLLANPAFRTGLANLPQHLARGDLGAAMVGFPTTAAPMLSPDALFELETMLLQSGLAPSPEAAHAAALAAQGTQVTEGTTGLLGTEGLLSWAGPMISAGTGALRLAEGDVLPGGLQVGGAGISALMLTNPVTAPFAWIPLLAGGGGSLLADFFGSEGQYEAKREAAGAQGQAQLAALGEAYQHAGATGDVIAGLRAIEEAPGIRAFLSLPPDVRESLGVPLHPESWAPYGGVVPWPSFYEPAKAEALMELLAQRPELLEGVTGSGDIPYLEGGAAAGLAGNVAEQAREFLRQMVRGRRPEATFGQRIKATPETHPLSPGLWGQWVEA